MSLVIQDVSFKTRFDRKQDTLFQCMIEAFQDTQGVPQRIYFDNMKTAVDHDRSRYGKVTWNSKLLSFAKSAGFIPKACRPFRPQTKGKVEALARTVEQIRVYNHEFENEIELENIVTRLANRLNQEISQATDKRPNDLWEKEKEYLQPIDIELMRSLVDHDLTRKVSRESMITYLGNKYSVPVKYIGKEVTVKVTAKKIAIFYASKLVRQHLLSEQKINYHHDDVEQILSEGVFRDLSADELEQQVQINLKMFDQLSERN